MAKSKTLLREKYTTIQGATKRAKFENGVAFSEYAAGWKARLYAYHVVMVDTFYRVERFVPGEARP